MTLLTSGNLEAEATASTTGEATTEAMAEAKKVTMLSVALFFSSTKKMIYSNDIHTYICVYYKYTHRILQRRRKLSKARWARLMPRAAACRRRVLYSAEAMAKEVTVAFLFSELL